ncbi:hypothetical protein GBO34_00885 [Roseivirga pacifica]|uniref:hypothetical protein n=1 Tax=Roseivirga pacifica TaxID=1267423 RepID=UPI0020944251|nr:hypothetical protein [Roseivirga pacifica]MCO6367868.1 hypothetical protein [Roseivirga pacifica]MCO6377240.1 hypothetical protein [Roseivirga pacifica]
MPENHTFDSAIDYLKKVGEISSIKDLTEKTGINRDRINYLRDGKTIRKEEVEALNLAFPVIYWDLFATGKGALLRADNNNLVEEPQNIYGSDAWKKAELLLIKNGKSKLPIEQREELLIERLHEVEQNLLEIHEINNKGMIDTLKDMLRGK